MPLLQDLLPIMEPQGHLFLIDFMDIALVFLAAVP